MAKLTKKQYATEILKVPEAEVEGFLKQYGDNLDEAVNGYLRQADYDRSQNEAKAKLAEQQQKLAAAEERLALEMAEWGRVEAGSRSEREAQQARAEKAEQDVLRLRQQVTRIATNAGIDPAKALEGFEEQPVTQPKKDEPPAIDARYVPREQFGVFANAALDVPATLHMLAEEHRELFGKPLDSMAVVAELKKRANTPRNDKSLDLRTIWEEMNGVPAKREENRVAKYNADIQAAEARGAERARTEMSLPGQPPPGRGASPVLRTPEGQARTSVLQRPQPGQTVNRAVSALRSRKYAADGAAKSG